MNWLKSLVDLTKIHDAIIELKPVTPKDAGFLKAMNAKVTGSTVAHPAHYNTGKIEVIEAIEDWKLPYHRGNSVKYIARAGKKDPSKEIEDLEKAVWYLKRDIELLKAKKEKKDPTRPNDMNPRSK